MESLPAILIILFFLLLTITVEAAEVIQSPVKYSGNSDYLVQFSIGSPPVPVVSVLDTGHDFIWTQCNQSLAVYNPSNSSTYSQIPCNSTYCSSLPTKTCLNACKFYISYGESPQASGIMATETFTFGSNASINGIAFGCATYSSWNYNGSASAGYLGLGRGNLSLITQLKIETFSYCIPSIGESKNGKLFFPSPTAKLNTAPPESSVLKLYRDPNKPSLYILSLLGVTIGDVFMEVEGRQQYGMDSDNFLGKGAMVIDTGISFSSLETGLYYSVKSAFRSQIKLQLMEGDSYEGMICFNAKKLNTSLDSMELPKLVFHFDGGEVDVPTKNYMLLDSKSGQLCTMILPSYQVSVMGNYMQQNMHLLYDLQEEKLRILKANCTQL